MRHIVIAVLLSITGLTVTAQRVPFNYQHRLETDTLPDDICAVMEDPTANFNPGTTDYTDSENVFWKNIRTVVIVHFDSSGLGWRSEEYIEEAIDNLNAEFSEYQFSFDLISIEYDTLNSTYNGQRLLDGAGCVPYSTIDGVSVASLYMWDPEYFMNIHLVPDMCGGILGFAYRYPAFFNAMDGVWVQTDVFGLDPDLCQTNRAENKTLIHEVGHYLGLYHVFQSTDICNQGVSSDCTQIQDRICDTAPITVQYDCTNPTCTNLSGFWTGDPWEQYQHNNHMDYYIDSCRTEFTYGQFLYMHNHMVYNRPSIIGETPQCWGDFDGDYFVGSADLLQLLSFYGEEVSSPGHEEVDLNMDGYVGTNDLLFMLGPLWGTYCFGAGNIPFTIEQAPEIYPAEIWKAINQTQPLNQNLPIWNSKY